MKNKILVTPSVGEGRNKSEVSGEKVASCPKPLLARENQPRQDEFDKDPDVVKGLRRPGDDVRKLVKQKSLGRTLSTSVLRIKKKRSFWSSEKVGQ